jgi:ATP-binding cassette subfamily B protein
VLDRGSVAEIGTHEELIAAGGRYASLVSRDTDQVLSG